jgi:hypothetical protein
MQPVQPTPPPQMTPPEPAFPNQDLITILQDCTVMCFQAMSELMGKAEITRINQIRMLMDCGKICEAQCFYTVTNSIAAKTHAQLCAMMCEACDAECKKFNDPLSQRCAEMLTECAGACRQYSGI